MRKLTSSDLRDLKLLKHYRIIRKWACKTSDLNDADLELLIYLDALDLFTKQDFKTGTFAYSWDNSCLLYTSPSPRDRQKSHMPSSA